MEDQEKNELAVPSLVVTIRRDELLAVLVEISRASPGNPNNANIVCVPVDRPTTYNLYKKYNIH